MNNKRRNRKDFKDMKEGQNHKNLSKSVVVGGSGVLLLLLQLCFLMEFEHKSIVPGTVPAILPHVLFKIPVHNRTLGSKQAHFALSMTPSPAPNSNDSVQFPEPVAVPHKRSQIQEFGDEKDNSINIYS